MRSLADPVAVPALWGIGTYGDDIFYPVSQEDVGRDTAGARRHLERLGIVARDHVLVISRFREAAHWWPFERAGIEAGVVLSCADAHGGEAGRVAHFCRALPLTAVIGVTPALLEGLRGLGLDPTEVLGRAATVLARPGAREELAAAGLTTLPVDLLGPALAPGCRAGALHLDGTEWALESAPPGGIVLRARRVRAADIGAVQLGRLGRPQEDCPCGAPGPVVVLEGS